MEVTLPTKLADFVRAQVRSGRYADADDVVRDALRRLQEAEFTEVPNPSLGTLVQEAMTLAADAQRDLWQATSAAATDPERRRDLVGQLTDSAGTLVDTVRKVPGAREVEHGVRSALSQFNATVERTEGEARRVQQSLDHASRALTALTTVLEQVRKASAPVAGRS